MKRSDLILLVVLVMSTCSGVAGASSYIYERLGDPQDVQTKTTAGIAMMGGGRDLDDAFRWLCRKGNGGDFLILRATGDDAYNPYVKGLCKMNSVATLIIPDRQSAEDPAVAEIIRNAEVVFISGGDLSNYVRGWQGTPVEDTINAHVAAGKPIGGTSAGLAVLGEFVYAALQDKPDDRDLRSNEVLADPYLERVTLVRNFLKIPQLENLLTDSHFTTRDRMGRSLGFLARIMQDGWSEMPREVAIDERSAVLVDGEGKAQVVGSGKGAYFMRPSQAPNVCKKNVPLTFRNVGVHRVQGGEYFDLARWRSDLGTSYSLSVDGGSIQSTQAGHSIY